MRDCVLSLLLLICWVAPSSAQSVFSGDVPWIRVSESVAILPVGISDICMIVAKNGEVTMEVRRQVLPASTAVLNVYEGVLSSMQRDALESLLNDSSLKELQELPDTPPPHIPTTSSSIRSIYAAVQREHSVQHLQYADWGNYSDHHSEHYESASQEEIEQQQQMKAKLTPLVTWLHSIDVSHLKLSENQPTLCAMPGS
jgi:hypothetical protein